MPITNEDRAGNDEHAKGIIYETRQLIHELNRAIIGPPGLTHPSTVHHLLGDLDWVTLSLTRTLGQLQKYLLNELHGDRLTHADGLDVGAVITAAVDSIGEAETHMARLGEALASAESAIQAIHNRQAPAQLATQDFPAEVAEAVEDRHNPPESTVRAAPWSPRIQRGK